MVIRKSWLFHRNPMLGAPWISKVQAKNKRALKKMFLTVSELKEHVRKYVLKQVVTKKYCIFMN